MSGIQNSLNTIASKRSGVRNLVEKWASAAKSGCYLCDAIVKLVHALKDNHGVDFYVNVGLRVNGPQPWILEVFSVSEAGGYEVGPFILLSNQAGSQTPIKSIRYSSEVASYAGSDQCIRLAKTWLDRCIASHPDCNLPSMPPLPTRILEISTSNPRLHITTTLNLKPEPYAALSHRWGTSKTITTSRANIYNHQNGISFHDLPKTFQDAITVARKIGFKYLWIDSLCIVQDDPLDWEMESARMADVFINAGLVIAATSSRSADEGFLLKRSSHLEGKILVRPGKRYHSSPFSYRRKIGHTGTQQSRPGLEGPLEERAWAFQERHLARRFLSFGVEELLWECRTSCECECDWAKQIMEPRKHDYNLDRILKETDIPGLYNQWRENIARLYSRRELTIASDKLVALSAIAMLFEKRLGDQYMAGLWKTSLVVDLAWWVDDTPYGVTSPYLPSWSWSSIESQISWLGIRPTAEVISIHCTPATSNRFGDVHNGRIILRDMTARMKLKLSPGDNEAAVLVSDAPGLESQISLFDAVLGENEVSFQDGSKHKSLLRRKAGATYPLTSKRTEYVVWCLRLGFTIHQGMCVLILGRPLADSNVYERLGISFIEFNETGLDDVNKIVKWETFLDKWKVEDVTII